MQNSICLVIDRLQAGFLGPYGNTWVHTPQWNRLASESFVFDQALCETPSLAELYERLWSAQIPGVKSVLLSDEPQLETLSGSDLFSERTFLPSLETTSLATTMEETEFARFFAAASEFVGESHEPTCWWLHSRGMAGAWDAPFEMRGQYADEEDPTPPDFFTPPDRFLGEDFDPDDLLGTAHAYAGQVSLLDTCLGVFLETFKASPLSKNTLLAVVGARGFPLGEHRRVGPCDEPLYNETIHVPLLLRFPEGRGAMNRSQALVQLADLPATLRAWHGAPSASPAAGSSLLPLVQGERPAIRDRLVLRSRQDRALRTPAWHYREPLAPGATGELFAKPDDRWEINEVADRMGEVVTAAHELLEQLETSSDAPIATPEVLLTIVD